VRVGEQLLLILLAAKPPQHKRPEGAPLLPK
jgi:hypothetical protein